MFGAFARRSYGADNPLIGYPLAYQYLTSIRPDAVPFTADDLLAMRARGWRANYQVGVTAPGPGVPLVSATAGTPGVQARATGARAEAAVAVTTGTLANPRVDDDNRGRQVSGRVAWKPVVGLVLGASAARGQFLTTTLENGLAALITRETHAQRALGLDAEYSRGYWIVRGELIESRWNLPGLAAPRIDAPLWARAGVRRNPLPHHAAVLRRRPGGPADVLLGPRPAALRRRPHAVGRAGHEVEAGGGVYLQRNLTLRAVGPAQLAGRRPLVKNRTFVSGQLSYWF